MNSACQQCRTELPEGADGRLDSAALALGHAAECVECAAWLTRVQRMAGELYGLESHAAPVELAGRVVAALQAGDRESRAVRAVENLSRVSSPETLAETIEDTVRQTRVEPQLPDGSGTPDGMSGLEPRLDAPSVLERLVREELAEPQKYMVRRVVAGLPRETAPAALDGLVEAQLSGDLTTRRPRALLGVKRLVLGSLSAAALLVFGLNGLLGTAPQLTAPASGVRPFEVVQADSLQSLDPMARSLVDGVSGGLLTARGL